MTFKLPKTLAINKSTVSTAKKYICVYMHTRYYYYIYIYKYLLIC